VQGDRRFANVVFSPPAVEPKYSTLIDFDNSGKFGERAYPSRFKLNIPDGQRLSGAIAGELLAPFTMCTR